MKHARTQVRDAAFDVLSSLPTTGSNIFKDHIHALGDDQLPAITVSTSKESSEIISKSSSGIRLQHALELTICAYVKASSDYGTILDNILAEAEAALIGSNDFSGLVKDLFPSELSTSLHGEGDLPIAMAEHSYIALYHTISGDPFNIIT